MWVDISVLHRSTLSIFVIPIQRYQPTYKGRDNLCYAEMTTHIQSRVDLCYTEMTTHIQNRVDLCYTEMPTRITQIVTTFVCGLVSLYRYNTDRHDFVCGLESLYNTDRHDFLC
jgi:hypothetical protein